jgi:hypothetical protein
VTNLATVALLTNLWACAYPGEYAMTNAAISGIDYATDGCIVTNTGEIRLSAGGTMTEPVETVSVATNVTHWNNEERSPHRFSWAVGEPQPGSITKEMTDRTETTEVVETRLLKFDWDGEPCTVKRERVLSRSVRRWVRRDTWVEEGGGQ